MKRARIGSIDLLRGIVMIIMALDHVRDYFHHDSFFYDPTDLTKASAALFFTRWITHFCAPIFILLAGTSAFLSGQKKTKKELSLFLLTRGIWLVFLELTVVDFSWFFNPDYSFFALQVIWALGICMICLSGLIFLPQKAILSIGLVLVAGHNLLDPVHVTGNRGLEFLWDLLHERKRLSMGGVHVSTTYPVLPWIGFMALGYCLGSLYTASFDPAKRTRLLFRGGVIALSLFILLRSLNIYGDLLPRTEQSSFGRSLLSFLNVTKYPPSLDYLLLTGGVCLLFLSLSEGLSNSFTRVVSRYGRVPFFFYIIHIYLIHLGALVAAQLTGFGWRAMTHFDISVSKIEALKGYGFSLGVVYLVWFLLVVSLYPLCKRYDRYKSAHKDKWWLSYL